MLRQAWTGRRPVSSIELTELIPSRRENKALDRKVVVFVNQCTMIYVIGSLGKLKQLYTRLWNLSNYYLTLALIVAGSHTFWHST